MLGKVLFRKVGLCEDRKFVWEWSGFLRNLDLHTHDIVKLAVTECQVKELPIETRVWGGELLEIRVFAKDKSEFRKIIQELKSKIAEILQDEDSYAFVEF